MRDEIADTCALEVAPGLGDALGIHFKGQKPALAQLAKCPGNPESRVTDGGAHLDDNVWLALLDKFD